ncbi:MAG: hypothetical protein ACNA8L_10445 [Luteolibacter sp.]
MTKSETATIRREIRALKSALTARQKQTARTIKAHRATIRTNEKAISKIESETNAFLKNTTDRLAILQGRLES